MIQKVIHYVWFGGNPMPSEALACLSTWTQFCPDYSVKRWDESNFDFSDCRYAMEAYEAKKWAFVSDYARIKILHDHGGIYMDVDVELISGLDELLDQSAFMGFEDGNSVNTGLMCGSIPKHPLFFHLVEQYRTFNFIESDGSLNLTPCVEYQTDLLRSYGLVRENRQQLVEGITVYPTDYFSPFNHRTGLLTITENTFSIHKYAGSWAPETGRQGTRLLWKYRAKYGIFWGSILRLFPYSWYILKTDGISALMQKVWEKFRS